MPGCILRVSGSATKVKKFLTASNLAPTKVFWRGEPAFPIGQRPSKTSGFNIVLSASSGKSIENQVKQATHFIRAHKAEMVLIQSMRFRNVVVDFGLYDLSNEERPWPSYCLPATFVSLIGDLGFEINLSFYGTP